VVVEGSHLLVAGGRTPNTDGIGLELAGVETDQRGHVKVDERLRSTAQDVWAVGDCAGSPYFTHIGFDDFRVVRDNLAQHEYLGCGEELITSRWLSGLKVTHAIAGPPAPDHKDVR
jgi:pyruvate/2-oxoglutarate dehydrogenase complex dihydrolipoamide dehydrogenase (E3) component